MSVTRSTTGAGVGRASMVECLLNERPKVFSFDPNNISNVDLKHNYALYLDRMEKLSVSHLGDILPPVGVVVSSASLNGGGKRPRSTPVVTTKRVVRQATTSKFVFNGMDEEEDVVPSYGLFSTSSCGFVSDKGSSIGAADGSICLSYDAPHDETSASLSFPTGNEKKRPKVGNPKSLSTPTLKKKAFLLDEDARKRLVSQDGSAVDTCVSTAVLNLLCHEKRAYESIGNSLSTQIEFSKLRELLQIQTSRQIISITCMNMNGMKKKDEQSVDWGTIQAYFVGKMVVVSGKPNMHQSTPLHAVSVDFTRNIIYDGTEKNVAYQFTVPIANAILFHPLQGYIITVLKH